jgi:hypothetical protein
MKTQKYFIFKNLKNRGFTTIFGILMTILVLVGAAFFAVSAIQYEEDSVLVSDSQDDLDKTDDLVDDNQSTEDAEDLNQKCIKNINVVSNSEGVNPNFEITGIIDNSLESCNWGIFEGQGGVAQLYFYSSGEWNELGEPAIVELTDENWMKSINNFEINIGFNNQGIGLSDQQLKVVLTEEDPSGMRDLKTFEIPLEL